MCDVIIFIVARMNFDHFHFCHQPKGSSANSFLVKLETRAPDSSVTTKARKMDFIMMTVQKSGNRVK